MCAKKKKDMHDPWCTHTLNVLYSCNISPHNFWWQTHFIHKLWYKLLFEKNNVFLPFHVWQGLEHDIFFPLIHSGGLLSSTCSAVCSFATISTGTHWTEQTVKYQAVPEDAAYHHLLIGSGKSQNFEGRNQSFSLEITDSPHLVHIIPPLL